MALRCNTRTPHRHGAMLSIKSRTCLVLATASIILLLLTHSVSAQITTDAVCLANMTFLFNSRDQSPCLVTTFLGGACYGGRYNLPALDPAFFYQGPIAGAADACRCSTVFYSMISACAYCQGQVYLPWSAWSGNCTSVYHEMFPVTIPLGTSVPSWAYVDLLAADNWNVDNVRTNGEAPDSSFAQSTVSPTSTSTPTSPPTTSPSSSRPNTGAIIGGVLGGLAALLLLLVALWWVHKRRKEEAKRRRVEAEKVKAASASASVGGSMSAIGSGVGSGMLTGARQSFVSSNVTGNGNGNGGGRNSMAASPLLTSTQLAVQTTGTGSGSGSGLGTTNTNTNANTNAFPQEHLDQLGAQNLDPNLPLASSDENFGMYRFIAEVQSQSPMPVVRRW